MPGNNKREYGIVHVPSGPHFPDASVAEGWVKLRNDAARKDDSDESAAILRRLESLEGGAKSTGSGLWAADGVPSVECSSEPSEPQALVEEWKGKPIEGASHMAVEWLDRRMARPSNGSAVEWLERLWL